jgi:hypothetical protein
MAKSLQVLVTGATGHQGGAVARQLVQKGHRVRERSRATSPRRLRRRSPASASSSRKATWRTAPRSTTLSPAWTRCTPSPRRTSAARRPRRARATSPPAPRSHRRLRRLRVRGQRRPPHRHPALRQQVRRRRAHPRARHRGHHHRTCLLHGEGFLRPLAAAPERLRLAASPGRRWSRSCQT